MLDYFYGVLSGAAALRFLWFLQFAVSSSRGGKGRLARLRKNAILPAKHRDNADILDERAALTDKLQAAGYTLGALALAVWGVMASEVEAHPYLRVALPFLSVAVLSSIGSTLLFRIAAGEATRMGYESGLAVAGLSIVLATLALAVREEPGTWIQAIAWATPAILIIRDLADVWRQADATRTLLA